MSATRRKKMAGPQHRRSTRVCRSRARGLVNAEVRRRPNVGASRRLLSQTNWSASNRHCGKKQALMMMRAWGQAFARE
jgi:hypothetical protein